jgi:predicted RNA-binding protein YlxR (DUF448 family)
VSPQPERTCIGCGRKAGQADLVRLALVEGRVAVDRVRRGGRGAWIHPDEACLEKAVRRKAFGRAFRGQVAAEPGALRAQLTGNARKD